MTVNAPTGSPPNTTIPVTLVISSSPLLTVPEATLSFFAELNSASPPPQTVAITYELAGRSTVNVVVEYQGVQSPAVPYSVVLSAPGIYAQNSQGSGPGAILNQDYSKNLPNTPAPRSSVVAVYMTGGAPRR